MSADLDTLFRNLPRTREIIHAIDGLREETGSFPNRSQLRDNVRYSDRELQAVINAYKATLDYREKAPATPATLVLSVIAEVNRWFETTQSERQLAVTELESSFGQTLRDLAEQLTEVEQQGRASEEGRLAVERRLEQERAVHADARAQAAEIEKSLSDQVHQLLQEKKLLEQQLQHQTATLDKATREHAQTLKTQQAYHTETIDALKLQNSEAIGALQAQLGQERGSWKQERIRFEKTLSRRDDRIQDLSDEHSKKQSQLARLEQSLSQTNITLQEQAGIIEEQKSFNRRLTEELSSSNNALSELTGIKQERTALLEERDALKAQLSSQQAMETVMSSLTDWMEAQKHSDKTSKPKKNTGSGSPKA